MGIHGLAKVIGDYAPSAVKENEIKNYFGECATSSTANLFFLRSVVKLQQIEDSKPVAVDTA